MKLRHPDRVKRQLEERFGLDEQEATTIIKIAEGEYAFTEVPAGEKVTTTLQLLATLEFLQETLADLDTVENESPRHSLGSRQTTR
jgi:hypothetical protein